MIWNAIVYTFVCIVAVLVVITLIDLYRDKTK